MRVLWRDLYEAEIGCQVAAENVTRSIWRIVRVLKVMREAQGWTADYLSKVVGVEVRTIHRIEQEVQLPKVSTLRGMLSVFGLDAPATPIFFTSKPKQQTVKKGTKRR